MKVGVIGGSGLYDIDGMEDVREVQVETPFGAPSDRFMHGRIAGVELFFLPRHGRGHRLLPHELNHRANLFAFKKLGVSRILSVSAVGSFREKLAPGDVVLVDQFVDRTKRNSDQTFFGEGVAAHIAFSHPICGTLHNHLAKAITDELEEHNPHDATLHTHGTYLNMEGPAFSTLAESNLYRSWGMDIIGMTNLAEAKLAREAEICYSTIAMVTDYDCWHETHETVSVEMVVQTLMRNAELAKSIIRRVLPALASDTDPCSCQEALAKAIITQPDAITAEARQRLGPIIDKYLGADT